MMKTKTPLLALLGLCLLLAGLAGASPTAAQTGSTVRISAPEVDLYPQITVYIDPTGRDGSPLQNLTGDQISVSEDGLGRELLAFQELRPGIQLVVAFNSSDPFAIQDINGRSRFDIIKETLLSWASQPLESSPDDLSLVTNSGVEATHLEDRAQWIAALEAFTPLPRETQSNFSVLARAIEIAADPVDQPGMKRVVLLFSAQPASDSYEAIDSLKFQALDNQVMVFSVLISSPAFFGTEGALKLNSLSVETGGEFLPFSGEEPLPDLGQLLEPFRSTYMLQYQSSIVSEGPHTLEVAVSASPSEIVGQRQFDLEITPPNPIFVSPPRSVTRKPEGTDLEGSEDVDFSPKTISLPILVEFPDGHPRDLEELIFRVDGEVMERKTAPPYDQVVWDLAEYGSSAVHYLSLEAVDVMGLSRMSVSTPIEIVLELPPQKISSIISRNAAAFLGLGLILLLGMTLFVLITRGTIHPGEKGSLPWIVSQGRRTAVFFRRMLAPDRAGADQAPGRPTHPYRLIPISDVSQQMFAEPITVAKDDLILGSRPGSDLIRIPHPSVIAEHSRITIEEDGRCQIRDLGSTAGTWINYQQIAAPKAHFLKDGDIIHIGEAAFRFQIIPRIQENFQQEE